jgi:hypothetical protein
MADKLIAEGLCLRASLRQRPCDTDQNYFPSYDSAWVDPKKQPHMKKEGFIVKKLTNKNFTVIPQGQKEERERIS